MLIVFTAGNGLTVSHNAGSRTVRYVVKLGSGLKFDDDGTIIIDHDGSLRIVNGKLGLMACSANNEILKWNNNAGAWGCASDLDTVIEEDTPKIINVPQSVVNNGRVWPYNNTSGGNSYGPADENIFGLPIGGCFTIIPGSQAIYSYGRVVTFQVSAINNGSCNDSMTFPNFAQASCYPDRDWVGGWKADGSLVPTENGGDVCPDPIIAVIDPVNAADFMPAADQTFVGQYSSQLSVDMAANMYIDTDGRVGIDSLTEGHWMNPNGIITIGGTYIAAPRGNAQYHTN